MSNSEEALQSSAASSSVLHVDENGKHRQSQRKVMRKSAPFTTSERLTHIPSGKPVLLKLPSGHLKSVVLQAAAEGGVRGGDDLISLGKFGVFRGSEIVGLPFGHSFEIVGGDKGGPSRLNANGGVLGKRKAGDEEKDLLDQSEEDVRDGSAGPTFGTEPVEGGGAKGRQGKASKEAGLPTPGQLRVVIEAPGAEAIEETDATNELYADGDPDSAYAQTAQLLTTIDISALKDAGVDGKTIIQQATEGNINFAQKTAFSQAKYRKRKESKHMRIFTPLAPTPSIIAAHNAERSAEKMRGLREDSIAQMLSFANVAAGGRYLIVDGVGGALTGSVLERLGGEGRVLVIGDNESPPAFESLAQLNLEEEHLSILRSLHWAATEIGWEPQSEIDVHATHKPAGKPVNDRDRQRLRKRQGQHEEYQETRQELLDGDWDGLLAACPYETISVLQRLIPHLGGSASIAVHSPFVQPLIEASARLRYIPELINVLITEPCLREYQVLPGRTHPQMIQSSTAGYVLS
ncbi:Gcd10p-domain-containing protein [Ceraceosorus guamensis]|uniref:tRNA (adenine(58)-N(1))-methyltransferase non-catalytic subunit TRM6 n=1 Tax=Ceraceosorus guamensis TaxID=1522189 RepID=A0A316VYW2_9BASI|nr:Gcd10p-domain-containing protein [Ceraceosorus guamensis]PWN42826.1 Gcd10p-domain-containing protein [Ceraceosorus guamensis]